MREKGILVSSEEGIRRNVRPYSGLSSVFMYQQLVKIYRRFGGLEFAATGCFTTSDDDQAAKM